MGTDDFLKLRQVLFRLALDEEDAAVIVDKATRAVSLALNCKCSFVEGSVFDETKPGSRALVVHADSQPIGTLVVENLNPPFKSSKEEAFQEIADLVGLCAVQARQTQAIRELQDESEDMLFYAPDAIFVIDANGMVSMANRRALAFIGAHLEEVDGRTLSELFGTDLPRFSRLREFADQDEQIEIEIGGRMGRRLASLTFSQVENGSPGQLLCVVRDITKERQAQLALRRSERTTLIGETVEYLIHEVSNPLAALLASVVHAHRRVNDMEHCLPGFREHLVNCSNSNDIDHLKNIVALIEQANGSLQNARGAGGRIQDTMKTLRSAYHRTDLTGPDYIDVRFEIGLAIGVVEQEICGNSPIVQDVGPLPKVQAVPLHLAEAFGALIKNAVQAAHDVPKGQVLILAETTPTEIRVLVEDDGPGIPLDLQQKVFMPFFTTKPLGDALGLGLTMADDTVRRVGGTIKLEPANSGGARFVVTLPTQSELAETTV